MAVEVGQILDGKYRISRLIGKGGMGAVYEATHLLIDRRVAVKELLADAAAAEHAITRFEREARAAGRIGSDHILQIFDVGVLADGTRYMVSEFLDGETLDSRIRRVNRLSAAEVLPIAVQLLTGLAAAHDAHVLHRDLKPDNVFLVRNKTSGGDFVKIIDFGIAKFQIGNNEEGLKMTKTGMVVGTPYYLSPEQARGTGEADARSDLYAVGVILYECLTGEVPFSATNFNDLIFKIVLENPRPPAERVPGLDPRLSDLVLKAMAREPAQRFQTARQLSDALLEWGGSSAMATGSFRSVALSGGTPQNGQTLLSSPPLALSPSRGSQPNVELRSLGAPTPASFGSTRNPLLSTTTIPTRSNAPWVAAVLGGLALLGGGGLLLARHSATQAPIATSAVPPAMNGVTVAPSSDTPTQPPLAATTPPAAPLDNDEAPIAKPSEPSEPTEPAVRHSAARPVKRGIEAPHHPVTRKPPAAAAQTTPAVTAQPAATTQPAAEPKPKRADWGY